MATFKEIYKVVKAIPKGKVASYGQVAVMVGSPRGAQMVGWALHDMDQSSGQTSKKSRGLTWEAVPWHRVINARGEISTTCREHSAALQAGLLQEEGVEVKLTPENIYKVDLEKYRW
ncbi:MAG: hypothetical protein A3J48_00860 [Candidatus Doudnabacteria bacterium RIFCSPHIGHO2_02_FULL_46_11]|uniref:Methylated-DNA-[protein]-cysteine S-methyltransferase DNA binding domain-containing protein n=1 Tax=Candidatus Doudnabacteria bacterium RIFCSPHIGHO2_02_FULL_46_11 TaxID=1817832 RepID=A0A1F5P8Q2_9BACT|nr:MAG: hypothetical protein A3J48_00860 [Candidatus Doudnabacteria bacterium RIFCSPHIGHO2_02_FULL_46_11]